MKIKAKKEGLNLLTTWQAKVLYLIRYDGLDRIGKKKLRDHLRCSLGSLNRIITDCNLDTIRGNEDARIKELLTLHRERPKGHDRFIETEMENLDMTWSNATALNLFRRDRDKKPEELHQSNAVILRQGKGDMQYNEAADGLTWLLSRGRIPQWAYDAGTAWRGDFEASESLRGQEVGKDAVQGGSMSGSISDHQAIAMDRLMDVREAIKISVKGGLLGTRYLLTRDLCKSMQQPMADALGQESIKMVMECLEAVGFPYGLTPSGDIHDRLSRRLVDGRLRPRLE